MPTYKNNTDKRITHHDIGYMEWQPGEEKRLSFYVPHEKLGLTLISDEPLVDRMVHDWTVTLTPDTPYALDLPYHEAFELSVYSVSGNAHIVIGGGDTPIEIREGESHFSMYTYARCPKLTFVSDDEAELRVKVEERNTKNTLRRGDI